MVNGVSRNASHVGICYAGNDQPNVRQMIGLQECIAAVEGVLGRTMEIEGHRDAPYKTQCPGDAWPAWKAGLIAPAVPDARVTFATLETALYALWNHHTGKTRRSRTILDLARLHALAKVEAVTATWNEHKAALG